jgi:hypothetical protein
VTDGQHPDAPVRAPGGTSGRTLAIASLVLGLCGVSLLPLVGSIAAIVTGHLARRRLAETPDEGGGFAVAGLVLGYAVVVAAALLLTLPLFLLVMRSGSG